MNLIKALPNKFPKKVWEYKAKYLSTERTNNIVKEDSNKTYPLRMGIPYMIHWQIKFSLHVSNI